MEEHLYIVNIRGEKKPFSIRKVEQSAKRAGASKELAREIAVTIQKEVYPGIKTIEIFRKIKRLLTRREPKSALKFCLKEAMRKLGPTGFPFEKYIGAIFFEQGFKVKLNQRLPGDCLRYEIDFLAQKDNVLYVGECKYRNLTEGLVRSKTILANYARFLDIKKGDFFNKQKLKGVELKTILVTNTRFSKDAVKFSKCVGAELLGWKEPKPKGLEHIIDSQNLYPITSLPSLKKDLAAFFVAKKMMLAKDVLRLNPARFAKKEQVSLKSIELLIKEAKILLE